MLPRSWRKQRGRPRVRWNRRNRHGTPTVSGLVEMVADLKTNPPHPFDLTRKMRAFVTEVQFIELRVLNATFAPSFPMTVRSSLMPRTPMAFGCSRWTTAGAGSSPPSSIGTPSVSAGMSARPLRPARSPWGLPGYGSTSAPISKRFEDEATTTQHRFQSQNRPSTWTRNSISRSSPIAVQSCCTPMLPRSWLNGRTAWNPTV